jgi:flagellar protein FliO/FliZ
MNDTFPSFAAQLGGTALALALVLALAWLALRGLKQLQLRAGGAAGAGAAPQVVRSTALGPRERVVVLHHRGQAYLLGVTPASIQLLDRWTADAPNEAPDSAGSALAGGASPAPSGAP